MMRRVPSLLALLLLLAMRCGTASSAVLLEPSMRTFGNALKSFRVKGGQEQLLYNFSSPPSAGQRRRAREVSGTCRPASKSGRSRRLRTRSPL